MQSWYFGENGQEGQDCSKIHAVVFPSFGYKKPKPKPKTAMRTHPPPHLALPALLTRPDALKRKAAESIGLWN